MKTVLLLENASQWGHGFVAVERQGWRQKFAALPASQWGHGFVAVESIELPGGVEAVLWSQWGHGFVAVERLYASPGRPPSSCRNGATAL